MAAVDPNRTQCSRRPYHPDRACVHLQGVVIANALCQAIEAFFLDSDAYYRAMLRKKKEKMTLGERLAAWKRAGRAKDERDLKAGRITEEQLFEKNFFFHGIDFSKAKVIRKLPRRAARPKKS